MRFPVFCHVLLLCVWCVSHLLVTKGASPPHSFFSEKKKKYLSPVAHPIGPPGSAPVSLLLSYSPPLVATPTCAKSLSFSLARLFSPWQLSARTFEHSDKPKNDGHIGKKK